MSEHQYIETFDFLNDEINDATDFSAFSIDPQLGEELKVSDDLPFEPYIIPTALQLDSSAQSAHNANDKQTRSTPLAHLNAPLTNAARAHDIGDSM